MPAFGLRRLSGPGLVSLALLTLSVSPAQGQEAGRVAGRVVSSIATGQAEAVPGVTVRLPELRMEGVTDRRGRFRFDSVPAGRREIRVEVIGCLVESRMVEVRGGGTTDVDFSLHQPAIQLPGVVATGATREAAEIELPFAVGRMDAAEMDRRNGRSIADLIRGEFPGARIVQGSGLPGSDISIQFRGPGSIASGHQPLIVVDGTPLAGALVDLNPRDVQNIRVLKGSAAAAHYGSRGLAGVIEVTTRGAAGERPGRGPLLLVDGVLSTGGLSDIEPSEVVGMEVATGPAAGLLLGAPALRAGVMRVTTPQAGEGVPEGRCSAAPSS